MTDGLITKFSVSEDSCQAEIEKLIMTCSKNKEREYLFLKENQGVSFEAPLLRFPSSVVVSAKALTY